MRFTRTTVIALAGGVVAAGAVIGTTAPATAATAPATGTAGTAAKKPTLRVVSAKSKADKKAVKTVTAKCPRGFRVVSGSSTVHGLPSGPIVRSSATPFHTRKGDGYTTTSYYDVTWPDQAPPTDPTWSVTTSAVCAKGLSGVRIVSRKSASNEIGRQTATVPCPKGTRTLGFGGKVVGKHSIRAGVFLNTFGPGKKGLSAFAKANTTGEDIPGPWKLHAYAVCAKPPAGWRLTTSVTPSGTARSKTRYVRCPKGTRPYGAGAITASKTRYVEPRVGSLRTTGHGSYADAYLRGDWSPLPAWQLRVYGICAR